MANEAGIQTGFFWHVHHAKLLEWCYGYDERTTYINTSKPKHERESRLRLFRPVKGALPQEVLETSQAYDRAQLALDQAQLALDQAWRVYVCTGQDLDRAVQDYHQARWAYDRAQQTYNQAQLAYVQASQAYNEALRKNMPAIEALHREECPNCPWDGKTIFPKRRKR